MTQIEQYIAAYIPSLASVIGVVVAILSGLRRFKQNNKNVVDLSNTVNAKLKKVMDENLDLKKLLSDTVGAFNTIKEDLELVYQNNKDLIQRLETSISDNTELKNLVTDLYNQIETVKAQNQAIINK